MKELYFSVDVEADGIVPGPNSMLSIGAVAINEHGEFIDEHYVTLQELLGSSPSPSTTNFWRQFPDAYKRTREGAIDPYLAMSQFDKWVRSKKAEKNIFVAAPAAFDFTFIHYYFMVFLGKNPFAFNTIDIRTFAMGVLGTSFTDSALDKLPKEWQPTLPHTHVAIEDAREQGQIFSAVLRAQKEMAAAKKDAVHLLDTAIDSGSINVPGAISIGNRLRKYTTSKPIVKIDQPK